MPDDQLLPFLVDLESPYEAEVERAYEATDLVRYALDTWGHHWADQALGWIEQGVTGPDLGEDLLRLEQDSSMPQQTRHRARHLRKAL